MSTQQQTRRARRKSRHLRWILGAVIVLLLAAPFMVQLFSPTDREHTTASRPTEGSLPSTAAETTCQAPSAVPSVTQDPQESWTRIGLSERALAEGTLVLVNSAHSFDDSLPQTVSVYENKSDRYLVKDIYLSVTPEAMTALNAWMDDFAAATGLTDVNIVAGWRSLDDQVGLYQAAVNGKGQAYADAYLALPGHSEHHTGLAVDLDTYDVEAGTSGGFDGGGEYAWAVSHAWEYGFIQRYPPSKSEITGISYESWHFRYVGLPHSYVMSTNNLCLEEYIDYLRSFPFDGEHLHVTCLGEAYEIYYCKGSTAVVPSTGAFTLSGNNVDGFIVTVRR